MAVLVITDSTDPPGVAEIDIQADTSGSGRAKWKCRTLGAFSDRQPMDEWQEATVKWFKNYRDEFVSTVCCYIDIWGDGNPLPCLELQDVYNNGILPSVPSGDGRVLLSRGGIMTEGDATWTNRGL